MVDGIRFDSQGEVNRYLHLKRFERQGQIKNLRLQVQFELTPTILGLSIVMKSITKTATKKE